MVNVYHRTRVESPSTSLGLGKAMLVLIGLFVTVCLFYPNISNPLNRPGSPKYDTMNACDTGEGCSQFGITLLLCFLAFVVFMSVCRVFPLVALLLISVMFGISLASVLTVNKLDSLFEYMKFVSVGLAALFLTLARISAGIKSDAETKTGWFEPGKENMAAVLLNNTLFRVTDKLGEDWWSRILWLTLAINISEAIYGDIKEGSYVNAVVGGWLILTMPRPSLMFTSDVPQAKWSDVVHVDTRQPHDLVYTTPLFWVLMYTSWDMAFAYSGRREHFAVVALVLVTALLTDLPYSLKLDPFLYIQARTYSLFMRYMILGIDDVYEKRADASKWHNNTVTQVWGGINLACVGAYTIKRLVM